MSWFQKLCFQMQPAPLHQGRPGKLFWRGQLKSNPGIRGVGRCTLTPPDPTLKGAWFQPSTYEVKTRFQNVPFKCNLHRCSGGLVRCHTTLLPRNDRAAVDVLVNGVVGLYTSNPVDP
jgi:hypothetical protein